MKNKVKNSIFLKVKDYSVSGEEFHLVYDSEKDLLITTPQPSKEKLAEYYKSDDYISHTNTKRNLFERIYHIVRSIALKRKLKLINSFKTNEKFLLDVGCGTGDFLKVAQRDKWSVVGIEPDKSARAIANKKTNGLIYNIEELQQFKFKSFDVITLWHVLEHLPDLEEQLELLKSLLKNNGILVIAVPNFKSYDASYYKEYWAAYDVPRHLWHFSQKAIHKLVNQMQMEVVKTKPMKFDSFYVSLLSEKNKFGKMNIFKASWIGLNSNVKAKQTKEYSSLIYCIKNR